MLRKAFVAVVLVAITLFIASWTFNNPVVDGGVSGSTWLNSDLLTATNGVYHTGGIDIRGSRMVTLVFETTRNTVGSVVYSVYSGFDGIEYYRNDMILSNKNGNPQYISEIEHEENTVTFAYMEGANYYMQLWVDTVGEADGTFKVHVMASL
jgi:hypothetical protein